jgi:hypothetical protein
VLQRTFRVKMKTAGSSEILLFFHNTAWFHSPEDLGLNLLCCENLKPHCCGEDTCGRPVLPALSSATTHIIVQQRGWKKMYIDCGGMACRVFNDDVLTIIHK